MPDDHEEKSVSDATVINLLVFFVGLAYVIGLVSGLYVGRSK